MELRFVVVIPLLVMYFAKDEVDGWFRRRRRRRWSPPPPQQCIVSAWTTWSECSQKCHIGTRRRSRTITQAATSGGDCPFHLSEIEVCGSVNGGCQHNCDPPTGHCSCLAGYTASGTNCNDINECNPSPGPCSHICTNTVGSYKCECPTGYDLTGDSLNCAKHDCGSPAAKFHPCPPNSYTDHISSVCAQVATMCPGGTTYDTQCSLICPTNYTLSKITAQPNVEFGKTYSSVDFLSVSSSIICRKTLKWQSDNVWDVPDSQLSDYYCRRSNDPPLSLTLNGSTLIEHMPVGTTIGTLSSQDAQQGQTFMYTVQRPSSLVIAQGDKLVNIWDNPRLNGNISLDNGKLLVTVRTTDNGNPPMWLQKTFAITISDVNDPPEQLTLSNSVVYENATVGMIVGELLAIDGDDPPNMAPHSNFKWELLDNNGGKFAISGNKVTVAMDMSGEAQKMHMITIKCSDFGNPVQFKTENFVIDVLNINDAPTSLRLTGSTVHEMAPIGTIVGQLVVTEKDGDDVSFDISQSDADTLSKFQLERTRCVGPGHEYECKVNLTVNAALDYETKAWHRLNVHVNDSQSQAFKHFNIEIINDNEAPTAVNLTGSHYVMENSVAGTVVGQFVVTDPDNAKSPSHQTHTCVFDASQASGQHYFIITTQLVLKVQGAQQIDYERIKNLTFSVTCTDSGHPPLSLSSDFFILVKDVNEPPVNLTLSSMTVDENSPLGTPVGLLSSDDPDGPDDVHTYSIVGPISAPFIIGGINNRTLLVNGNLDHETDPTVLVIVRVTDTGGLSTQKTFKITVNDVNDPPSNLTLSTPVLEENSAERVLISPIILTDQDGDLPSCVLLNSAGGRVKVIGTNLVVGSTVTDYESLTPPQQFTITLNCSDQHGRFIWKSFVIAVTNVNEPPAKVKLSAASVDENAADTVIGQVTVSDPDKGQSHYCTVHELIVDSVTSTEKLVASEFFTVDNALKLRTLKGLNFEVQRSVDIVVNCSDGRLSKSDLFSVTVNDVNEIPSGLCNVPIMVGLQTSVGAVIAELNGKDPDNENVITDHQANQTVIFRNKQQLFYSMSPVQNSWPFGIRDDSLFKSGAITQPQNITISVQVKDDGVIVGRGYQYILSTPLSAVFNCTIVVSAEYQPLGILLDSSNVSVTADSGAVVGSLTTVTKNAGETFTYQLLEERSLPFRIQGNKLLVARKDGLEFQVSSSGEPLIAVSIISRGNMSNPLRETFFIRIVDDRPRPVNICLSPHIVNENQPAGTVIGQVIIDDSSSPILTCTKQHCCPDNGRHFHYECNIDNPEENAILPDLYKNVTALFLLDEGFRLRTRVKLNYSDFANSNGSVDIQVSCQDTRHPLHFIGSSVRVTVADCHNNVCSEITACPVCQNGGSCQDVIDGYSCQCMPGFTGRHCQTNIDECQGVKCLNGGSCEDGIASFKCKCAAGFSGELCERSPSLCAECTKDTMCVTFTEAAVRCLGTQYQIPILLSETEISDKRKVELEEDLGKLLDSKTNDAEAAALRKRRALSNFFYVEILRYNQTVSLGQTVVIFTALNASNNYYPFLASRACALLENTARSCVENCDILKLVGLPCGQAGLIKNDGRPTEQVSKGLNTGGVAGIAIFVVIFVIAVLFSAVFYYRKKYKGAKPQQDHGTVGYQANREGIDFSNEIYGDNRKVAATPPSNRDWAERLRKESDIHLQHNLDPTSVMKRNDIKVMENPMYVRVGEQNEGYASPLQSVKSVSLPDVRSPKAEKKEDIYLKPIDEDVNGPLGACYARSTPMLVSLGSDEKKFQKDETWSSENDLDTYMKGAKAKVRAANATKMKKFKRQRSDEKVKTNDETESLNNSEIPSSFENPVYGDNNRREEAHSTGNPTYSTIPALLRGASPLPPIPTRTTNERPSELLEIREDDTYESLNFGQADA